jgi:hypothetical protein
MRRTVSGHRPGRMVFTATGHPALHGEIVAVLLNAVPTREPDLYGVPDDLCPLLARCAARVAGGRITGGGRRRPTRR